MVAMLALGMTLVGMMLLMLLVRARTRAPSTTAELGDRLARREARSAERAVVLRSLQDELELLRRGEGRDGR